MPLWAVSMGQVREPDRNPERAAINAGTPGAIALSRLCRSSTSMLVPVDREGLLYGAGESWKDDMRNRLKQTWLAVKWRCLAAYHITCWLLKGAPLDGLPFGSRWRNVVFAWSTWRAVVLHGDGSGGQSLEAALRELRNGD